MIISFGVSGACKASSTSPLTCWNTLVKNSSPSLVSVWLSNYHYNVGGNGLGVTSKSCSSVFHLTIQYIQWSNAKAGITFLRMAQDHNVLYIFVNSALSQFLWTKLPVVGILLYSHITLGEWGYQHHLSNEWANQWQEKLWARRYGCLCFSFVGQSLWHSRLLYKTHWQAISWVVEVDVNTCCGYWGPRTPFQLLLVLWFPDWPSCLFLCLDCIYCLRAPHLYWFCCHSTCFSLACILLCLVYFSESTWPSKWLCLEQLMLDSTVGCMQTGFAFNPNPNT